jgi:hypothetical protein
VRPDVHHSDDGRRTVCSTRQYMIMWGLVAGLVRSTVDRAWEGEGLFHLVGPVAVRGRISSTFQFPPEREGRAGGRAGPRKNRRVTCHITVTSRAEEVTDPHRPSRCRGHPSSVQFLRGPPTLTPWASRCFHTLNCTGTVPVVPCEDWFTKGGSRTGSFCASHVVSPRDLWPCVLP